MRIIDWSSDVFSSDLDPDDENSTVMHVAAPIRDAGGRIAGVLTVSKPNQAIAPFIERSEQAVLRWGLVLLGTALRSEERRVGKAGVSTCRSRGQAYS